MEKEQILSDGSKETPIEIFEEIKIEDFENID